MTAIGFETQARQEMVSQYVNTPTNEWQGHFDIEHALADLSLGEVLQDQESIHRSLIENSQNDYTRASSSQGIINDGNPGNSSQANTIQQHLSLDEALARQLQVEEWDSDSSSSESEDMLAEESPSPINESNPSNGLAEAARQDDHDIDPDNMTYEERASLVEEAGNESRGLSNEVISDLPTEKYECGFFPRRGNNAKCAICLSKYKNGQWRIYLRPCKHVYHADCITPWLKINKVCPVCREEVFGP